MTLFLPNLASPEAAAFEMLLVLNEMHARMELSGYVPHQDEVKWLRDAARQAYAYQQKARNEKRGLV